LCEAISADRSPSVVVFSDQLMVEEESLGALRAHVPKTAHYVDRSLHEPVSLVEPWNLIVLERIHSRTWSEVQ